MRKILIVHETRILRTLLKTYLISVLNDVVIIEAPSAAEALEKFKEQKFEVIICGMQFKQANGIALFKELKNEEINKDTPFIIVTSTGSKENDIQHYFLSPFTPIELREKINTVCDPRQWCAHDSISMPDAKAIIHVNNDPIDAGIINAITPAQNLTTTC